ncbi:hypothetical protein [Methylogaea oryzae]|nr:hypothetical protein [Methylogaea oryzae]
MGKNLVSRILFADHSFSIVIAMYRYAAGIATPADSRIVSAML